MEVITISVGKVRFTSSCTLWYKCASYFYVVGLLVRAGPLPENTSWMTQKYVLLPGRYDRQPILGVLHTYRGKSISSWRKATNSYWHFICLCGLHTRSRFRLSKNTQADIVNGAVYPLLGTQTSLVNSLRSQNVRRYRSANVLLVPTLASTRRLESRGYQNLEK